MYSHGPECSYLQSQDRRGSLLQSQGSHIQCSRVSLFTVTYTAGSGSYLQSQGRIGPLFTVTGPDRAPVYGHRVG